MTRGMGIQSSLSEEEEEEESGGGEDDPTGQACFSKGEDEKVQDEASSRSVSSSSSEAHVGVHAERGEAVVVEYTERYRP